jgi:cob(I)alamin adenosyltransferase
MSIATKRGDGGQTGLAGGVRVSKADPIVETYGTVDELISSIGLARALCRDEEIAGRAKQIQRELFKVGSALATQPASAKPAPEIGDGMVDALTADVERIEDAASAAFDVARAVCRRAERLVVARVEAGAAIQPNVLRYLNRLSDALWLFGRLIEFRAGLDSKLREQGGPRWSRAW